MNRLPPAGLLQHGTLAARRLTLAFLLLGTLSSCRSLPPAAQEPAAQPRVRFLLTFDDGPSIRTNFNPTLAIMNQLVTNDVQPGIRAIFFVQTGHPRGGGTPQGRAIMRVLHEHGQVLGIHSVSPKGHISHTSMATNELVSLLQGAKDLLRQITGEDTLFLRPPFGARNPTTQRIYEDLGLDMLMSDIRARDGIIYGYRASLSRRIHIRFSLRAIKAKLSASAAAAEPFPIVVQFHDVNPYTAHHMTEYLHILVEEARREGLALSSRPFYDTRDEVRMVGVRRSVPPPDNVPLRNQEGTWPHAPLERKGDIAR